MKVLDFGLAKALDPSPTGDPSQSPTLTAAATQMGVIMGTAAYMSPGQARGKATDRRADVWAFGAVLFEMLTGKRAFEGEDVSVTLANVINQQPQWDLIPGGINPSLRTYLERCLEKEPGKRVQAIGDVRLAMEGAFDTAVEAPTSVEAGGQLGWRATWPWALGTLFIGSVATAMLMWSLMPPAPERRAVRFTITSDTERPITIVGSSPDIALAANGCSALGFLDSGVTVFASTLPRPARRGHVAPGRGFDSGTSLASTARCTSA